MKKKQQVTKNTPADGTWNKMHKCNWKRLAYDYVTENNVLLTFTLTLTLTSTVTNEIDIYTEVYISLNYIN